MKNTPIAIDLAKSRGPCRLLLVESGFPFFQNRDPSRAGSNIPINGDLNRTLGPQRVAVRPPCSAEPIALRILSAPRAGFPDALHERKAPDSLNPIGAPPGTRIPRRSAPVLRRCTNLQLFRQVLQELPHFGVAHICGVAFLMERGRQYSHVYVCAGICGLNLFVCCIFNRIALRLPYVRLSSVGVERAQQIDAR